MAWPIPIWRFLNMGGTPTLAPNRPCSVIGFSILSHPCLSIFGVPPHFRKPPYPSYFELFTAAVSATKKKDLVSCPSLWPWLLKRANRRRQWGPNDQPVGPEVWNAWPVCSLGSKHGLLQSYFKLIQRGLHMLTLPMARPMMRRGWGPQRQFHCGSCVLGMRKDYLHMSTDWE